MRTQFLMDNRNLVFYIGRLSGIPRSELWDFYQEVLLRSLCCREGFDPRRGKLTTYAGNFARLVALTYLRRLKRQALPTISIDCDSKQNIEPIKVSSLRKEKS